MIDYGMEIKQIRVLFWPSFSNGTAGFSKRTLFKVEITEIAKEFYGWLEALTKGVADEFVITNCGVIR